MKIRCRIIPLWLVFIVGISSADERAQPSVNTKDGVETYGYNWEALKTHPVPAWYDEAKFGIFIHWGPSSVPGHIKGGKGYAEWMPRRMYEDPEYYDPYLEEHFGGHPPEFGYKDFIPRFKAENWDPDDWAELFDRAGAKYVVLTAEHHDGYAMWDSELTPWSATKTGPMRDLVGDLGKAVRKRGLKYAPSYHRERHTLYFASGGYRQKNTPFPDIAEEIKRVPEAAGLYGPFEISDAFIEDYVARWKEIEEKYRPDLMWIDHIPVFHEKWCEDFDHSQIKKYQTACMKMIADYFNAAEGWGNEVYVNNKGPEGRHNWPLGVGFREADNLKLKDISTKWQNPATLGTSYGYMKWEEENDAYKTPTELIHLLCDVVSKNGNLLLNIGPRADGTIPQGMRERLLAIGQWLETNGEAIYGTRPWAVAKQEELDLRFTTKGDTLFAIAMEQPAGPFVIRNSTGQPGLNVSEVSLLGSNQKIEWRTVDTGLEIIPPSNMPGEHAWTFKIQIEAKAVKPPNILILYADDMGYGDLAIQNPDSKIPTPNLDRLAREGMRFTDGHSSSGVCTPSRYALLTGRHHWRKFHGIVNSFGPSSFNREWLTLPEMLQEKGYATAHIGKWHLGFDWNALLKPGRKLADPKGKVGTPYDAFDWSKKIPDGPTAHGFDYSFTDAVINFPPYTWIENDRVVEAPDTMMDKSKWKPIKEGHWECRPGPMATGWNPYDSLPVLTRKGVSYIEAQAGSEKPFFLFFAFPSPHAPIIPNDVFDGTSQAGAYGDFMVETDDVCGQLLRALEENGFSENTLVVFSSDNGAEHYLVRRYLDYGHSSSGPFRGMKQDIYEGGHRVPFLVKWPGITQPGSVSDALISQIDIMRTLAVQLDCTIPEGQGEDSLDMMPVLRQEQASVRKALVYNTWSKKYGMREGDWVYLTNTWERKRSDAYDEGANFPVIQAETGLFNLNDDIGQRNNLVEQYPERAEHLKNLLNQVRQSGYPEPARE